MSRIPLSLEEEHTLGSMARWMRFMAVVGICAALAMLLIIVLAIGVFSMTHAVPGPASDPREAKIQAFLASAGPLPYILAAAFLVAAGVALWQNMILFHAGDDFHLVTTTDTADLDYLAHGLDRLRTFFKIQVLTVAVAVTVAFVAGIVAVALMRAH
jgi:hypothetical protein